MNPRERACQSVILIKLIIKLLLVLEVIILQFLLDLLNIVLLLVQQLTILLVPLLFLGCFIDLMEYLGFHDVSLLLVNYERILYFLL
jgi:hypothetical protein